MKSIPVCLYVRHGNLSMGRNHVSAQLYIAVEVAEKSAVTTHAHAHAPTSNPYFNVSIMSFPYSDRSMQLPYITRPALEGILSGRTMEMYGAPPRYLAFGVPSPYSA